MKMKHWIAVSFLLAVPTTHALAQTDVKTSLQGRDVRQICDVDDFAKRVMPLVILDLTKLKDDKAKAYFFDEPSDTVTSVMEKTTAVCAGAPVNRNFSDVVTSLPSKATAQPRWIATASDVLWIVVLAPSTSDKIVQVVETRRKTRLAEDIAKLGDLVKAARAKGFFNEGPSVNMIAFPYALHEVRADLSVKVMSADEKNPHEVITIKTGPPEHGWISANLPLNSVKQLSLDKNNAVQLKDVPKEFLIGFNYQWGDVYDQRRWDVGRAFGTVMARFSKQPLDTLGAGLGYNFGSMSAFAGPVWIHQPKTAAQASANAAPPMRYKMNLRVGLTFDLGTAIGWVSKKAQ